MFHGSFFQAGVGGFFFFFGGEEGDGYSGPSVPLKKHRDSHIALPDGLCEDPFTGKDVTGENSFSEM